MKNRPPIQVGTKIRLKHNGRTATCYIADRDSLLYRFDDTGTVFMEARINDNEGPDWNEFNEVAMEKKPRLTHEARYERRKQIAKFASQHGASAASLEFHVGINSVYIALREHGLSNGRVQDAPAVSSFRILKDLLSGAGPTELVERYGVSKQRISKIKMRAQEAGFKFN